MLEALNGTWRTWETGYPIRFVTLTEGELVVRERDRKRKQYQPRSKLYRKKMGRPRLVVDNSC